MELVSPTFATEGVWMVQVPANQASLLNGLHQAFQVTQTAGSTNCPLAVIRGGG